MFMFENEEELQVVDVPTSCFKLTNQPNLTHKMCMYTRIHIYSTSRSLALLYRHKALSLILLKIYSFNFLVLPTLLYV